MSSGGEPATVNNGEPLVSTSVSALRETVTPELQKNDYVLDRDADMLMSYGNATTFDPVSPALKAKVLALLDGAQWLRGEDKPYSYEEYRIMLGNTELSLRCESNKDYTKYRLWFYMQDGEGDGLLGVLPENDERVCIARYVRDNGAVYDYLPDGRLVQAASWHDSGTGLAYDAAIYWDGDYRLEINGDVIHTESVIDDALIPPYLDGAMPDVWMMPITTRGTRETLLLVSTRNYPNCYGTLEDWRIYRFSGEGITELSYAPGEWERMTLLTEQRDDGFLWVMPALGLETRAPEGILSAWDGGLKEDIEALARMEERGVSLTYASDVIPDVLSIDYNDYDADASASLITFLHPISAPAHDFVSGIYITYYVTEEGLVAREAALW